MIFVTTGTQAPFDRFIKIIDTLAPTIDEEIVVQAFRDRYEPRNIRPVSFLAPESFEEIFSRARLIISHAGMGTIIKSMQQRKPVIVMPRIAALGEHRNEHQLATARQLEKMGYIYVASDADSLRALLSRPDLEPLHAIGDEASPSLIQSLSDFIG